jgi:hypothetical protein
MRRHLAYLKYVVRHKWYVFLACLQLHVPVWIAILHDISKFSPTEWSPYARNFFEADGRPKSVRNPTGAYDPSAQPAEFLYAWLQHQKNLHHWQAWIVLGDGGSIRPLPMLDTYIREMVADWVGAGKAKGTNSAADWYEANKASMVLHNFTRWRVEELLKDLK